MGRKVFLRNTATKKVWPLPTDEKTCLTIGRNDVCDVVVQDAAVSRFHAEIFMNAKRQHVLSVVGRNGVKITTINKKVYEGKYFGPLLEGYILKMGEETEFEIIRGDA